MENDPLWVNLTDIFKGKVRYRDVIDKLEKKFHLSQKYSLEKNNE